VISSGNRAYSPLHNDIWALGIMLINLATGRNPWKSATLDDPTFRKYRRNPRNFLPSVLPISEELNDVLVQVLAIDWKKRISLSKFRAAVNSIRTFYSDQVVFEGNLAVLFSESELCVGNNDGKPLPATPGLPIRSRSQITTIDGLVDEACVLEGKPTEFEFLSETMPYSSPVHSTYRSSSRTSSSDSASPITPVGDFSEVAVHRLGATSSQEKVDHSSEKTQNSPFPDPYSRKTTSSFTSSVFYTPSLSDTDDTTISMTAPTHGDNYKTVNRYSSPNTSIYSIAESIDFPEGVGLDSIDETEEAPETHTGRGTESIPIPIPIPRGKSKSHIFNPKRFFPRSGGKSWLNRKVRLHFRSWPATLLRIFSCS
jgi:hypothetical protein